MTQILNMITSKQNNLHSKLILITTEKYSKISLKIVCANRLSTSDDSKTS